MKRNDKRNHIIEKYRVLRNFMENNIKNSIKCISVTSNSDNEGKTPIAKNLAMSLAVYGKKTLFVDCSLGGDTRIENFDIDSANGLIDVLKDIGKLKAHQSNRENINEISLKNYIKETECEYLSIAFLGEYNLDSYGLVFRTEYLKVVMELLKTKFDYIIIDAPSFTNLSYTQIVTGATDGCLFILKEGVNEITQGATIRDKINTIGCKVLGCVLNKEKDSTKIFDDKNNSFFGVNHRSRKGKVVVGIKNQMGV